VTPGRVPHRRTGHARAKAAPATAAARPGDPPPPGRARATLPWALAGALAILPLIWASRGPTLGVPVADDYLFLSHLAFESPLDLLGPMGAAYYWRPVSRQLYFLLLGPWLLRAPWLAPLLAVLLLLALYAVLYRLARRRFDPPVAAALACFPLLAEPARIFLAWPSAAQHLLGALFAALAVERAAAGSLLPSGAAALLALLSNEAAFVVLPALPLLAWFRTRSRGETARWSAGTLAVVVLWGAGYAVSRAHGTGLPPGAGAGLQAGPLWVILVQALVSQLGYEGLAPALRGPLLALCGVLAAAALAGSFSRPARKRIARAAPALLGGLAWFAVGVVPLAFVLPDWNAWRTTVASLGLAFALTGWLALVSPSLAGMLVALRLAALLLARPAPADVTSEPLPTASSFSLARITRLQRTVESTRTALLGRYPHLGPGAIVRYWNMPRLAEVGFAGSRAPRVWYDDSTLVWTHFGGEGGLTAPRAALVEYDSGRPWPATVIEPQAVTLYVSACNHVFAGSWQAADSLLGKARAVQPGEDLIFFGLVALVQAQVAWKTEKYARADSLLQASNRLSGPTGAYWVLTAMLAQHRGDHAGAVDAVRECLALDPKDPEGLQLARDLGFIPRKP
jgi:hypothetical protein